MRFFDSESVGIDLGTANVRIYIRDKGIVLDEPSVVAVNRNTGEMLAIGEEAHAMLGRQPGSIAVVRPLKGGVISNYHDTERMLRYFLRKVIGRKIFFRPRVTVCVPSGVTDVERRALLEVAEEAGARSASLIEEPIAAAIGAGIDIAQPYGSMIIDIGGGTTDVAVIALGGMVVNQSIKVAGDSLDEAVIKYVRKKFNILIGEKTAAEIKINIGSAFPRCEEVQMEVAGRHFVTGLPTVLMLKSSDVAEAFYEPLNLMLRTILNVLERTPPELASDIAETGICVTGGGAYLYGIEQLITKQTGLPCYVADNAISCVVTGTGRAADHMDTMQQTAMGY
jgi:rod shape-determining protein MreB